MRLQKKTTTTSYELTPTAGRSFILMLCYKTTAINLEAETTEKEKRKMMRVKFELTSRATPRELTFD